MNQEDQAALLRIARESISTYFSKEYPYTGRVEHLSQKLGVFVTLHKNGKLRGCIGYPIPAFPLYKGVIEAARAAAFQDPRFPPLQKNELKQVKIEISVLTRPQLVNKKPEDIPQSIEIGKDGLILKGPRGSGLLLPQVATENNFAPIAFLRCVSMKAGLEKDAWLNRENQIFKFQAEVFSEK
jgi:hypothetical protein